MERYAKEERLIYIPKRGPRYQREVRYVEAWSTDDGKLMARVKTPEGDVFSVRMTSLERPAPVPTRAELDALHPRMHEVYEAWERLEPEAVELVTLVGLGEDMPKSKIPRVCHLLRHYGIDRKDLGKSKGDDHE